jgi:E3 ubiquitin-protein ligase RFWD2
MNFLVSSVEFDRDDEFFAAGTINKKLFIYDYNSILSNRLESGNISVRELQKQGSSNNITTSTFSRRTPSAFPRQNSNASILSAMFEADIQNADIDDEVPMPSSIPNLPVKDIYTSGKISCLSWNPYIKNQIATSDYEGVLRLWDVTVGKETMKYEEHDRRTWAVDFSHPNPTMLCSAGEDGKGTYHLLSYYS